MKKGIRERKRIGIVMLLLMTVPGNTSGGRIFTARSPLSPDLTPHLSSYRTDDRNETVTAVVDRYGIYVVAEHRR